METIWLDSALGRLRFYPIDHQRAFAGADADGFAVRNGSLQQHGCQRVLQAGLDDALEGPRAVDRIVAGIRQPFARRRV